MGTTGVVYLVGAGPGNPELLTLKAARLLQEAQVVVYDRLVGEGILDLIPVGASRMAVGKVPGHHCVPQAEINSLLVTIARTGRRVVRLKGGDPFLFGRGSEEALYLRAHGIPFEVVPGITAASAACAYAGIPLTHRGQSRMVQLVTGHLQEGDALDLPWGALAKSEGTLAFYMGLANLAQIAKRLIAAGLDPQTPAAAIQSGSLASQRRVIGTAVTLPGLVQAAGLEAPVLIVFGAVVQLAEALDWFIPGAGECDDVSVYALRR
jgi:uroporphyrin-III C-methyltransferase/precorrin-2 dehydrogenase/sirohydrochlorin ferrochelatase/uroporphyrin-III C-methyltransferase